MINNISKENKNETDFDKIREGLELAYDKMLEFKIYKKTPVIVEQDGKIVELDPKILLEERRKAKEKQ